MVVGSVLTREPNTNSPTHLFPPIVVPQQTFGVHVVADFQRRGNNVIRQKSVINFWLVLEFGLEITPVSEYRSIKLKLTRLNFPFVSFPFLTSLFHSSSMENHTIEPGIEIHMVFHMWVRSMVKHLVFQVVVF
jgi:hypothetical protein